MKKVVGRSTHGVRGCCDCRSEALVFFLGMLFRGEVSGEGVVMGATTVRGKRRTHHQPARQWVLTVEKMLNSLRFAARKTLCAGKSSPVGTDAPIWPCKSFFQSNGRSRPLAGDGGGHGKTLGPASETLFSLAIGRTMTFLGLPWDFHWTFVGLRNFSVLWHEGFLSAKGRWPETAAGTGKL